MRPYKTELTRAETAQLWRWYRRHIPVPRIKANLRVTSCALWDAISASRDRVSATVAKAGTGEPPMVKAAKLQAAGKSPAEVAAMLGCSFERAQRLLVRARRYGLAAWKQPDRRWVV